MKFFGKNSVNPQAFNLPALNGEQQAKLNGLVEQPNLVSLDVPNLLQGDTHKSASVKLINYVEPFTISGIRYTLFYSEFDTKFLVNDKVYIVSGNYDSDAIIQRDPFSNYADGYTVLFIDRNRIVLDIEYDGTLPYNDEDIDNFIKVYVASSQEDFEYFIQTTSNRDFPYLVNRFANFGTFSTNNFLYINGTFSLTGNEWGILGFTGSGSSSLTYSNSFLVLSGTTSGYLEDITTGVSNGIFSRYLSATLDCNRYLYIMNDSFALSNGTDFRTGVSYRWCDICNDWRSVVSYRQPFITRLNFRNGIFLRGEFNQGLMGTHVERIRHNSSSQVEFNLGTILNTDWLGGNIRSGQLNGEQPQDSNSYVTETTITVPFIRMLSEGNNDGFGYNFVYESHLNNVSITQANIFDSILGTNSNTVVYEYLIGTSSTFDVSIARKSNVWNSKVIKTNARFTNFYSSQIINSFIQSSNSINSELEKSVFLKSRFLSDKVIKLDNYDERNITWWSDNSLQTFKLYKFYISKENFSRLVESQNFYFDGLVINKPNVDILNFFDDKFSIDAYRATYDTITGKNPRKVIIQLSTAAENLRSIDNTDITYQNFLIDNVKDATPSIDVMITPGEDFNTFEDLEGEDVYQYNLSVFESSGDWGVAPSVVFGILIDSISYTFSSAPSFQDLYDDLVSNAIGTWTFSNSNFEVQGQFDFGAITFEDTDGKIWSSTPVQNIIDVVGSNSSILDINKAYIIDSDFKSGLFDKSIWVSGNYINYNQDHTINIPANSDYAPVSIDHLSGLITLGFDANNRRRIIKQNDIVFFNRLELDSSSLGYSNLVRLPDTYRVSYLNESSNNYVLEDVLNGTFSVFYTFTQSVSGASVIKTNLAQNAYIYAHPVKFRNSTIKSGIFRRAYFEGTVFDNENFIVTDRDPVTYDNWRSLLVSDTIFSDNNNIFRNGLLLYSHWIAGSDDWRNGIVQNSIWNSQSYTYSLTLNGSTTTVQQNVFKNGIFRQSRWVDGIFGDGLFYKNNSNSVYTTQVYNDDTDAYYRRKDSNLLGKTRWAFLDGVFKDGIFEMSHFENGLFENGQFFISTFLDGIATGGIFGKTQLDYTLTRVGAGTFSDLNVLNANFWAENPTGQLDSYFNIEWLTGVFNSGVFGVRVVPGSYSTEKLNYRFKSNWYDGTFNNGRFQDTAVWHSGEFNNGRFISYFGYPWVLTSEYPISSSQSFAWRSGNFNNGFFGTSDLGTNSTWYIGQFNDGIFKGRYWQNGVFVKGLFEGSGAASTVLANVPNYVSNFSELYYGLWNDGYVNELGAGLFSDREIFNANIREVEREGRRRSSTATIKNALWRGGTFSHGDGKMENCVWTGGLFESGDFINSSFNPYVNYFVNGEFKLSTDPTQTDGSLDYWSLLYSDFQIEDDSTSLLNGSLSQDNDGIFSKKLIWSGTSSYGKIWQTTGLTEGEIYKLRVKLKQNQNTLIKYGNFVNILRNRNFTEGYSGWTIGLTSGDGLDPNPSIIIATGSPGYLQYSNGSSTSGGRSYLIYPSVLQPGVEVNLRIYTFNSNPGNYPFTVGSCDSSKLELDNDTIMTDFVENISASFSQAGVALSNIYQDSFVPVFEDLLIVIDSSGVGQGVSISGIALTNNRTLYSANLTQSTIVETSFTSQGGDFSIEFVPFATANSSQPPTYLDSSSEINYVELISGESGFNTSPDCRWDGGRFVDSEFYYSVWKNGFWENGLAMGMIWKNGIAKYMNAFNVYWQGGLWRNGNWNGSPWSLENITEDGCLYSYDLLNPTIAFKGYTRGYNYTAISSIQNGTGVNFESAVDSGNEDPLRAEIDGTDSSQTSPSVFTDGYFFDKAESIGFTIGKRYRITINLSKLSVVDQQYRDRPAIYFSIGRPYSQNALYGNTSGSLYPSFADEATGRANISARYQIISLEGHTGTVVPDLYTVGVDGYESLTPGSITEVIEAQDDGNLYIHVDMFACFELFVDSVIIEEEICTKTGVVSPGFARDILSNISDYRLSISDSEYNTVHLNNVFTETLDPNWSTFPGTISPLRFTWSGTTQPYWQYASSYTEINGLAFIGCIPYPGISNFPQAFNISNYTAAYQNSPKLYAMTNDNLNIFSQSGDYRITLKYFTSYESTNAPSGNIEVKFDVGVGYDFNVTGNGGFKQTVIENIRIFKAIKPSEFGSKGCLGTTQKYYGKTNEKTLEFVYSPTNFAELTPETEDSYRFYIQKKDSSSNTRLRITYLKIQLISSQYSSQYNNKLYTIFDSDPEIGDVLALPSYQFVDGLTSSIVYSGGTPEGIPISIRLGNGIFTSGTASAFSSIWEFGVWNEGWRYDRNVIYFTNFMSFNDVLRPLVYAGVLETQKVKGGQVATQFDQNVTQLLPSQRIFTVALYRTVAKLYFDDGFFVDQEPTVEERSSGSKTLREQLKVGDRVSVGNVVAIDSNGERRLITDTFKVVDIISPDNNSGGGLDIVYLQITLNFDAKTIRRDSNEHLIYISKNIWQNGAFLNGVFRGIWTNGLFKGRPYITKMKDSQWISGIFDGGHFQAKTFKYPQGVGEDLATFSSPSGIIQYFTFRDNDLSTTRYQHNYNSWIDVNYFTSSTVTIGLDRILFNEPDLTNPLDYFVNPSPLGEYTDIDFYSIPTKDVLRSNSYLRSHVLTNTSKYQLGISFNESTDYLTVDRGDLIRPGLQKEFQQPLLSEDLRLGTFNRYYNTAPQKSGSLKDAFEIGVQNFVVDGFTYGTLGFTAVSFNIPPTTIKITVESPGYLSNRTVDNLNLLEIKPDPYNRLTSGLNKSDVSIVIDNLDNKFIYDNFERRRYNYISFNIVQQGTPQLMLNSQDLPSNNIISKNTTEISLRGLSDVKEYFYNRRGLDLTIRGISSTIPLLNAGTSSTKIDNLKFVETDMIPFFLLGTSSRINSKVQSPLGAVSPFIDYGDSEFSFMDSLVISETIFTPLQNPSVVVTPGTDTTSKTSQSKYSDVGVKIDANFLNGGLVSSSKSDPSAFDPATWQGGAFAQDQSLSDQVSSAQKTGGFDRFGNPIGGSST